MTQLSHDDSAAAGLSIVLKKSVQRHDSTPLIQWLSSFDSPLEWIPLIPQNGIIKAMPVTSSSASYTGLLQSVCQQITNGTAIEWQDDYYDVSGVEFEVDDLYQLQLLVTFNSPIQTSIERATQSLVFKWIGAANQELANKVHDQQLSPFSVACESLSTTKVRLHIATLQRSLLSPLLWGMSRDLGQTIQIIKRDCELHPKVAITRSKSFKTLSQIKSDDSTVSLFFLSPTSFREGDHIQPFPLPRSVFGGLLKRWNAFAPVDFLLPRVDWNGLVAAYSLKTKIVRMEGGPQIGSVGWVRYRFPDPEQARIAHILANFADFAGIGRKTAMGMGQTSLRRSPTR